MNRDSWGPDYTVAIDEPPPRDEPGTSGSSKTDVAALLNPLEFRSVGDVLGDLAAAPPVRFLAKPVIPSDAYGVIAALWKAGKTWLILDLAVAVAAGKAWLGHYEIETPGTVLIFLGEGGPRKMMRRLKAIADNYDVELAGLPIRLCFRAPHLSSYDHLQQVEREIEEHKPVLIIVDPLYLAARGAQGSQLYEMGAMLETIQAICQRHDAALVVAHHFNRGDGKGAARMSGAGPAEWGRFLITADAVSSRTDMVTQESDVVLRVEITGDEIADTSLRIRRKVAVLDPNDLNSPMLYSVEVLPDDAGEEEGDPRLAGLSPASRRVLAVLGEEWKTKYTIGDELADEGHPLKARTIQSACKELVEAGHVEVESATGLQSRWKIGAHASRAPWSEAQSVF